MNWNLLIENMPELLSYLVYGYVFLSAYKWVTFTNKDRFEHLLVKSVAVSYILKSTYDIVLERLHIIFLNQTAYMLTMVLISAFIGLILGRILSLKVVSNIFTWMGLGRTANDSIWDDVIRPGAWIRVYMEDGSSYLGQYRYMEANIREPIIALSRYQLLDDESGIVIDYSETKNDSEMILLNTKDFARVEISYTPAAGAKSDDTIEETTNN